MNNRTILAAYRIPLDEDLRCKVAEKQVIMHNLHSEVCC